MISKALRVVLIGFILTIASGAMDASESMTVPIHHRSNSDDRGPFPEITSLIRTHGSPTLCRIGNISPNGQGGTSVINIFSFSTTTRCDSKSTAHQGTLYLVQSESTSGAKYFLALAAITPAFQDGWQRGQVAIILGIGTPYLRQLVVLHALSGRAHLAFFR